MRSFVRRRRALPCGLLAVASALALSACAAPSWQFARQAPGDAQAGTVLYKVPTSWNELPGDQLTKAEQGWQDDTTVGPLVKALSWQAAYDASGTPSAQDVLGTTVTDQPTVYAFLRQMYQAEQSAASVAGLRDMLVPVSTLTGTTGFTMLVDETKKQGTAQGVHLVYRYTPTTGGPQQTVDQTAYLSSGADAVYLFVVRCSSACYDAHRDEIAAVTSSYTIQEDSSG